MKIGAKHAHMSRQKHTYTPAVVAEVQGSQEDQAALRVHVQQLALLLLLLVAVLANHFLHQWAHGTRARHARACCTHCKGLVGLRVRRVRVRARVHVRARAGRVRARR